MTRVYIRRFRAAFVLFLGIMCLTYPMAAQWLSAISLNKATVTYAKDVAQADVSSQLAQMQQYNASLPAIAVESSTTAQLADITSDAYHEYEAIGRLPNTDVLGQIVVPKLGLSLPIYHGTTDDVLNRGVGHLFGTPFPIGGQGMHTVLSAHSGLADKELFTHLGDLGVGDTFDIFIMGKKLRYQVSDIREVVPTDTSSLQAIPGRDLVTLVTCTPIGINSHRLLVTAQRVEYVTDDDIDHDITLNAQRIPGFPYWIVIISAATIMLIGYTFMPKILSRRQQKA